LFIARVTCADESAKDLLLAEFAEAGTLGVLEVDALTVEAWFGDEVTARQFSDDVAPAPGKDWVAESQAAWHARQVGSHFFLVPPWSDEPAPAGRLRLEYHPGMACGTGEHPGTRLALIALERAIRPGDHVLDVGTGSGILTKAARLLGAVGVIGCDIEPGDIAVARENHPGGVFFIGSARAIRAAAFDVVVANINAVALRMLLPDLLRVLKPGGRLALSGFRPAEMAVPGAEAIELEGWQALLLRLPGSLAPESCETIPRHGT
jgi:ribosomal protein L11 methyltransferase